MDRHRLHKGLHHISFVDRLIAREEVVGDEEVEDGGVVVWLKVVVIFEDKRKRDGPETALERTVSAEYEADQLLSSRRAAVMETPGSR